MRVDDTKLTKTDFPIIAKSFFIVYILSRNKLFVVVFTFLANVSGRFGHMCGWKDMFWWH
jgi:hypothetical protein